MTKQLYEEALADVKKLKEVAEDNAKRALLEAVTPRIKDLIENQLLGEAGEDEDKLLMDEVPEEFEPPAVPVADVGDSDLSAAAISMPDEEGKVTLDLDALKTGVEDEFELSIESASKLGMLVSGDSLIESSINKLGRKINRLTSASKIVKETKGYNDALKTTIEEVENTYSQLQNSTSNSNRKSTYEELLESFYSTLNQLTEQKMKKRNSTLSEADITLKLTGVPDELADKLDDLGVDLVMGGDEGEEEEGSDEEGEDLDLGGEDEDESSDEEGGEDLDLDLGGEDEDEEEEESEEKMESRRLRDDLVVEIDEGMLRREISRMKSLREADETKPQSWGHGAGDVSDEMDFEDDDLGDPLDLDLTTEGDADKTEEAKDEGVDELDQMDEMDEMDELDELDQVYQAHGEDAEHTKKGEQPNDQSNEPGKTVESLRRRLRAEVRLQMEAKQKAQAAKKQAQQKQKEAQQKKQEAQQKQNEAQQKHKQGKKQEAQQKQKEAQQKKQEAQQKQKQSKKMQEAYNFFARKFNESVARSTRLKGLLSEVTRRGSVLNGASNKKTVAEAENLRVKLAETNLFNAKLLFTNKLLQNESLTKRQKAEVIERLDEARSEREVKLVYESLVKTLQGSTSQRMTETADRGVIGSSSRPARPASTSNTLNEGFEADRWARLAGIVK